MTDQSRAAMPHCDTRVLHAPRHLITVGSLVWHQKRMWLSFHPIDAAPALPDPFDISREDRVQDSTSVLVIPLTEPASRVLGSPQKRFDRDREFGSANGTEFAIMHANAPSALPSGERRTLSPLTDELNWPKPSGVELPLAAPMFARSALAPVRIVMPVSRGSSWSLTTGTATEGWATRPSLPSSVKERWSGSSKKLPSAIWSVLTAIAPELTIEQWQQEHERRSECEYCDHYPDWQELRQMWSIAFTGHEPTADQLPCPADHARPPDSPSDHRQWHGNTARKADR